MIQADYVAERPDVDVKSTGYRVNNIIVLTIGEIEISLDESDARELHDDLDGELNTDTREDLEDRLEKATDKIYELTDEISELKAYIEQLEGEKE
jgi:predicted  nucleic acid-binding Zn-ribbon protein